MEAGPADSERLDLPLTDGRLYCQRHHLVVRAISLMRTAKRDAVPASVLSLDSKLFLCCSTTNSDSF